MLGSIWRGACVLLHALLGTALALGALAQQGLRLPTPWVDPVGRWWHRRLCRCLRLRLTSGGTPERGVLLVANHVSWMDIPVLGGLVSASFVSKDEVRRWPLVGQMAVAVGTLFIKRGAHQSAEMIEQAAARLADGGSVLVFPEGTTGDGLGLRRFQPRPFALAQRTGCLIQPVAIRYGSNQAPDPVAPFVGDDSLAAHLLRVLRRPDIPVEVSFLPVIPPDGSERRHLAASSRAAIADRLGLPATLAHGPRIPRDAARRQHPPQALSLTSTDIRTRSA